MGTETFTTIHQWCNVGNQLDKKLIPNTGTETLKNTIKD